VNEARPSTTPVLSRRTANFLSLLVVVAACVIPAAALLWVGDRKSLARFGDWFDPLFFAYNLALLVLAQLLAPFITFMYVRKMKGEKARRLRREIPEDLWAREGINIQRLVDRHFRFSTYLGSVVLVVVVITLGASIILLLKPTQRVTAATPVPATAEAPSSGVDYSRGANMLLLGPAIEQPATSSAFYHRVILSLTAFQFGFVGAFIYFIGHVVRAYFTLDLTPHTFVDAAVRMSTASVLALVVSFVLPLESACGPDDLSALCLVHPLPLVSFFLGYFPSRALLLIEKLATRYIRNRWETYNSTSLSVLPGMSIAHEVRLGREGFDNMENLSHADTLDLAVRTGFSFRQLRNWIGQAWLRLHLGSDFEAFERQTGLTSRAELQEFLQDWEATKPEGDPAAHLTAGQPAAVALKVDTVCRLLRRYEPHWNPVEA
jgi:hypothetical protein